MRYKMSQKCSEGFYTVNHITQLFFFKPVFPLLYLQMMLERRTNQGMLRLIQPKDGGCVSNGEKPKVKDKAERDQEGANSDHEGKRQHEKADETNRVPSHTSITKPVHVNVSNPPAVEKTSPVASPALGKLTYNPITHVPSRCEFFERLPVCRHLTFDFFG